MAIAQNNPRYRSSLTQRLTSKEPLAPRSDWVGSGNIYRVRRELPPREAGEGDCTPCRGGGRVWEKIRIGRQRSVPCPTCNGTGKE